MKRSRALASIRFLLSTISPTYFGALFDTPVSRQIYGAVKGNESQKVDCESIREYAGVAWSVTFSDIEDRPSKMSSPFLAFSPAHLPLAIFSNCGASLVSFLI